MNQKRISTSSFAIEKPVRTTRNPSLQLENKFEHQMNTKFSTTINNAIRRLGESQTTCKWQLEKFEQKRKLHGLKAKLRWRDLQSKHSVLIKICVPSNYDNIKTSKAYDPDDFILEVESINFNMVAERIKNLQSFLDDQMKQHLRMPLGKPTASEDWLLHILEAVSGKLNAQDKSEFKDKLEILTEEPVVKPLVNQNYILCPSPIALAWSPQGILTVGTHNSVPRVKGSYIGTRKFLNFAFEGGKSSPSLSNREDSQVFQDVSETEQTEPTSMYHWSVDENLDFMDSTDGKVEAPIPPCAEEQEVRKNQQHKKHRNTQFKKSDIALLVDLSKTPLQLAKLYRQHFSRQTADQHLQGNHDRIRMFRIEGSDKQLQNDLMFLLYRASDNKDRPQIQSIVKNQLCGYLKILQNPADLMQYRLISKLLGDKLRSTKHLPLYLKAMMVQNDMVSQLLSRHFSSVIAKLQLPPVQFKIVASLNVNLGSYLHFQYSRAQSILFEILKATLDQPTKTNVLGDRFLVKTIKNITRFDAQMILTEEEAVQFYRRVIPILQLRNRNASYLEYRKIMRIILANDQLRNFMRVLNQMVDLYHSNQQAKRDFLRHIVKSYNQKQQSSLSQKSFIRRLFRIQCQRCGTYKDTYELTIQQDLKCDTCCSIFR